MKPTITLSTSAWSGYWERYGKQWAKNVANFNTQPDEIVIVSDTKIDTSFIKHDNVKNIVFEEKNIHKKLPQFRNVAIKESSCDWFITSDLDDIPLPNYLDNLDDSADIHGFSFFNKDNGIVYYPNSNSLKNRLIGKFDYHVIPGTSAIKRNVFNKIRYEDNCYEDHVFFATASKINLKLSYDLKDSVSIHRFNYSGYHPEINDKEVTRVSNIYTKVLLGDRNLYTFWFSKEMNENRKKCLDVLKKESGVNVVLIDYDKFYEYENKEIPIHPGFKYLTDVHKSDYAKCYMMYFYGEGCSDIKANYFNWNKYFDELFLSTSSAISYSAAKPDDLAMFWDNNESNIKEKYHDNYYKFAGNGHYIFKPKTTFAYDRLMLCHKILDENYDTLVKNPGLHPYLANGGIVSSYNGIVEKSLINVNYPFTWSQFGGYTNHKIQYKNNFNDYILTMPDANMENYR